VLGHKPGDGIGAEVPPSAGGKQRYLWFDAELFTPDLERGDGLGGQGRGPLLSTLCRGQDYVASSARRWRLI
jgi:hypothetical protein